MENSKILSEVNSRTKLEQYRETGRTPLTGAFHSIYDQHGIEKMKTEWIKKYNGFIELINQAQGPERAEIIKKGIFKFQRLINRNSDPEVKDYFEGLISELINANPQKDWSKLYAALIKGNYIKDASLYDFNEVMNYKRLPAGKGKIIWGTIKAEAVYFQKEAKFTMKQFNQCFVFKDGTAFKEGNRLVTDPDKTFTDLLKNNL